LLNKQYQSKQNLWLWFLWANWVIVFVFWFSGSGVDILDGWAKTSIAFGRLAGLSAAYMILLQFFFMGRMPWLERYFGLDGLSRIHHSNGKKGLILLLVHPILISFGYAGLSDTGLIDQFLALDYVALAFLGLVLFVIAVVSSLYIVSKRLKYESWYFVHLIVYLAMFFSFWHQIEIGHDLTTSQIFYWYWILLYASVFTSHIAFRFIRPVLKYKKHGFYVKDIVRENSKAVSVYIGGKNLKEFDIQPGQFMIFRFLSKGFWWQAHPFSLSMAPNGTELRITIKELGDFTSKIKNLKIGTGVFIDGPYGIFTDFYGVSNKVLMIAGGIGITPIRSLMDKMLAEGKQVTLLYANQDEESILFKKEIDDLAQRYNAKVIHVLSGDPSYEGEKGYVDENKIKKYISDIKSQTVYICGPVPMMDSVKSHLSKLGVLPQNIISEQFYLG